MLDAVLVAVGVVFVAELGDKSQLLTLTFAARYRWTVVLLGVSVATALLMAVSVALGGLLGGVLPQRPVEIVAGVVFLGFAVWTWRGGGDDDPGPSEAQEGSRSGLLTVIGSFALAELGDKTMLTAITLASTNGVLGTWVGASVGMIGANLLALVIGDQVGARLSPRLIRAIAAVLFAAFGVALLLGVG